MRWLLLLLATLLAESRRRPAGAPQPCTPARATESPVTELARVTASRTLPNGLELQAGAGALRITALSDDIIRVQATVGAIPPDSSLGGAARLARPAGPVRHDAAGFATATLRVSVAPDPLALTVADTAGHVLWQSTPGRPIRFGPGGFEAWRQLPDDEAVFGLGDKTGPMNRRGRAFVGWNTDAVNYGDATDPLYKTIPFLLSMRRGVAHGLFLDNTWRSHFDIGVTRPDAMGLGAAGGPLDLYVIAGPDPKRVLENYTALTGRMKLPPLWSLGFQQSRWSYDTQARVQEVADSYRAHAIPLDAIWLDIGYQDHNRPFTVDTKLSRPARHGAHAGGAGHQGVAITDLHIAALPDAGYAPYDSGVAGDHFVHNPDGSRYVGTVWPGPSRVPDFSRATARGGAGCTGVLPRRRDRRVLERHERTLGVRRTRQDHAAGRAAPRRGTGDRRRARPAMPNCTTPTAC